MWLRSLPNIKAQAQVTILMQRYCALVAGKHSRTIRDSGSIIMDRGFSILYLLMRKHTVSTIATVVYKISDANPG